MKPGITPEAIAVLRRMAKGEALLVTRRTTKSWNYLIRSDAVSIQTFGALRTHGYIAFDGSGYSLTEKGKAMAASEDA